MKFFFLCCCSFAFISISAQIISPNDVYKKIKAYYSQNPSKTQLVSRVLKTALAYDTINTMFVLVHVDQKTILIGLVGKNLELDSGWILGNKNYELSPTVKEKYKLASQQTMPYVISQVPFFNSDKLEKIFGKINVVKNKTGELMAVTDRYVLLVDPVNYRITSCENYEELDGRMHYDKYSFVEMNDTTEKKLIQNARELVHAANDYKYINDIKLIRRFPPPLKVEGKTFPFNNLVSFNNGSIDSLMKSRYVILNFFYIGSYRCNEMRKWILDWLPTVDTSKVLLVIVDSTDKISSLEMFVKDRNVHYPIIAGDQAKQIEDYYRIQAYPTCLFITPKGTVKFVASFPSQEFLIKAKRYVKQ